MLKSKGYVTDPMLKGALITDTHADHQPKALQSPELLNKRNLLRFQIDRELRIHSETDREALKMSSISG
ncbi:hypothetical protein SynPROS91_01400 [Synechococcus sp. PROS-9-1]|nr:hypothetical protein SynPROS91_01400 [Synechococcus sp. PROS-9-1]